MLKCILGRAGSGKTEYVFNSIKNKVESGKNNILLITPEQFSFVAERRLLTDLGESKVNNVKNISFSRLSNLVSKEYGYPQLPVLSKGAKAVMVRKALDMVQDNLILFGNKASDNSFVDSFVRIYDEMKSCRVTTEDILTASKNCEKELLSQKLTDISVIIDAYDTLIDGNYLDPANELTRIYEKLLGLNYFDNSIVYIDGFSGFVAQEYKILEVVLSQASEVYVTFCTDSTVNNDKYDLFSYVNNNINILTSVAKKIGVPVLEPVILNRNFRAGNNELALIEKNFYANVKDPADCLDYSVNVYSAFCVSDECDHVSAGICDLLRSGYKASDIAVVCRDLNKYENELKASFSKYDIPYFHDDRQSINNESIVMFVCFLLRVIMYSYRSEDIFSLLKTGLTSLSNADINALENYIYMWSINGVRWKNRFTDSTKGFVEKISDNDRIAIDSIDATRDFIISRLNKFANHAINKSPAQISKAIYYTLLDFGVDDGVRRLAVALDKNGKSALAVEQGRVWDLVMDILDKLALVGGDAPISLNEYYNLFMLMVSNEDLGVLPTGLDNVQIGSADRMRYDNPKAVFIVGANEGEFPMSVVSSGLLSEADRSALISNDFKLYSYGETLNAQEKYFAYMAVSAPTDRLYVSYIGTGEHSESSIVREIKSILPNIPVAHSTNDFGLDNLYSDGNSFDLLVNHYNENTDIVNSLKEYFSSSEDYHDRLNAVESIVGNEDIKLNNTDIAKALFKENMYLSASRIEEYYNCAFRYFCKFGIGARPRSKAEMDPMQTGTVIHYVLEQLVKNNDISAMDDAQIKLEVNRYLNYYLNNLMGDATGFTARFNYKFLRLSDMLTTVATRLRDEFSQSDFRASAFELKIGDGADNEPVKSYDIPLENGGSIRIKGSIDRVDVFDDGGIRYVRVVDYKSGTKKFQLSDILYGLNLQMLIYLFALTKSDSEYSGVAAGVLYMHSARSIYNMDRNASAADINKKDNDEFKMQGFVLNDEAHELAQRMEHDLKGNFIPAKMSSANVVVGNVVTLGDIGILSRKIDSLIATMGNNLLRGNISHNPVNGTNHDHTCDYCDYKAVCSNRVDIAKREIESLSNNDVISTLKEEFADE
ncbi:MAG: PD-(D/E)XK nuclease family protein [Eubacterium sp.]